jgi:hypothetical protein
MISVRTLGTSAKKKRAKMPATAPKDPAVMPLEGVSIGGGNPGGATYYFMSVRPVRPW